MNRYVDYINKNVLPKINYGQLQADYLTEEKAYAKNVLNALHKSAVEGEREFMYRLAGTGFIVFWRALGDGFPDKVWLY